jgi:hypothetical protein
VQPWPRIAATQERRGDEVSKKFVFEVRGKFILIVNNWTGQVVTRHAISNTWNIERVAAIVKGMNANA